MSDKIAELYNKLTQHEITMVRLLYSEMANCQEWIQKHTTDAEDREPINIRYSMQLASDWQNELNKLKKQLDVFKGLQRTRTGGLTL